MKSFGSGFFLFHENSSFFFSSFFAVCKQAEKYCHQHESTSTPRRICLVSWTDRLGNSGSGFRRLRSSIARDWRRCLDLCLFHLLSKQGRMKSQRKQPRRALENTGRSKNRQKYMHIAKQRSLWRHSVSAPTVLECCEAGTKPIFPQPGSQAWTRGNPSYRH